MRSKVHVVTPERFHAWIKSQLSPAATTGGSTG